MRSRAARRTGGGAGIASSPWSAPARLDLGPDGVRLLLEGDASGDGLGAPVLPAVPVLLAGATTCNARGTLDALVAAVDPAWPVARVRATPGVALWPGLVDALRAAAFALDDPTGEGSAPGSATPLVHVAMDDLAAPRPLDERADALTRALGIVADHASSLGRGLVLVVDDLHAAPRRDSEAVLRSAGVVGRDNRSLRAVASASHRSAVGIETASRARWTELSLRVTPAVLTELDARVARVHGRCFEPQAIDELVRSGNGAAGLVTAHAAAAWESTSSATITLEQVRAASAGFVRASDAALRGSWTGRLSIGQRRCLRAIADDGGRTELDAVARRLGDGARFGLSKGMLDTVLSSLVQRGLVVVHEGVVELAVPGLISIL